MPYLELPQPVSLEENAAALRGLYEVNKVWWARQKVWTLVGATSRFAKCKYRRERPDRWTATAGFLERGVGDCEEFLTTGGVLVAENLPRHTIEGWLVPGAHSKQQHCFLTAQERGKDKILLDLAVEIGGMQRPPPEAYRQRAVKVF